MINRHIRFGRKFLLRSASRISLDLRIIAILAPTNRRPKPRGLSNHVRTVWAQKLDYLDYWPFVGTFGCTYGNYTYVQILARVKLYYARKRPLNLANIQHHPLADSLLYFATWKDDLKLLDIRPTICTKMACQCLAKMSSSQQRDR